MIILLLITIILYVFYAGIHGYIAKQLDFMEARKGKEKLASEAKGKWHFYGLYFRVALHLSLAFLYASANAMSAREFFWAFLLTAILGAVLYDKLIDFYRKKLKWKFVGTCESWGDIDCFWLALQKVHINPFAAKIVVFVGSYLIYFYRFDLAIINKIF